MSDMSLIPTSGKPSRDQRVAHAKAQSAESIAATHALKQMKGSQEVATKDAMYLLGMSVAGGIHTSRRTATVQHRQQMALSTQLHDELVEVKKMIAELKKSSP